MKMIIEGTLREDTFVVRENPKECHSADVFAEISDRLPLDMDNLTKTYFRSCAERERPVEDWWAWEKANRMVLFRPDIRWKIIQALVASAKSDHELWFVGTGLLWSLLENHGAKYIEAIEERAKSDPQFQQ